MNELEPSRVNDERGAENLNLLEVDNNNDGWQSILANNGNNDAVTAATWRSKPWRTTYYDNNSVKGDRQKGLPMEEDNKEVNELMSHAPPQVAEKQDVKSAVKEIFEKVWRPSEADDSLADAEESV
eukprot:7570433-Heterocapsa_arctica.AAC.1